jgi:hypothetical protein
MTSLPQRTGVAKLRAGTLGSLPRGRRQAGIRLAIGHRSRERNTSGAGPDEPDVVHGPYGGLTRAIPRVSLPCSLAADGASAGEGQHPPGADTVTPMDAEEIRKVISFHLEVGQAAPREHYAAPYRVGYPAGSPSRSHPPAAPTMCSLPPGTLTGRRADSRPRCWLNGGAG